MAGKRLLERYQQRGGIAFVALVLLSFGLPLLVFPASGTGGGADRGGGAWAAGGTGQAGTLCEARGAGEGAPAKTAGARPRGDCREVTRYRFGQVLHVFSPDDTWREKLFTRPEDFYRLVQLHHRICNTRTGKWDYVSEPAVKKGTTVYIGDVLETWQGMAVEVGLDYYETFQDKAVDSLVADPGSLLWFGDDEVRQLTGAATYYVRENRPEFCVKLGGSPARACRARSTYRIDILDRCSGRSRIGVDAGPDPFSPVAPAPNGQAPDHGLVVFAVQDQGDFATIREIPIGGGEVKDVLPVFEAIGTPPPDEKLAEPVVGDAAAVFTRALEAGSTTIRTRIEETWGETAPPPPVFPDRVKCAVWVEVPDARTKPLLRVDGELDYRTEGELAGLEPRTDWNWAAGPQGRATQHGKRDLLLRPGRHRIEVCLLDGDNRSHHPLPGRWGFDVEASSSEPCRIYVDARAPEPTPEPEWTPEPASTPASGPGQTPAPEPTPVPTSKPSPVPPDFDSLGFTWIEIPGGEFLMGSEDGDSDEKPAHKVRVSPFRLSKTEVTVAQYRACVNAGACTEPDKGGPSSYCNWGYGDRENHPVNCVDWDQAVAFATWVGGRLPTEAEWEYAARGKKGRTYPWGEEEASCERAIMDEDSVVNSNDGCGKDRTWPVCSKEEGNTPEGLCDMAGNVWEWANDWYGPYPPARTEPYVDPAGPSSGSYRVLRGGSWINGAAVLRGADRVWYRPSPRNGSRGFRVRLPAARGGSR